MKIVKSLLLGTFLVFAAQGVSFAQSTDMILFNNNGNMEHISGNDMVKHNVGGVTLFEVAPPVNIAKVGNGTAGLAAGGNGESCSKVKRKSEKRCPSCVVDCGPGEREQDAGGVATIVCKNQNNVFCALSHI